MKIINPSIEVMHTGLEKGFMTPEQFIEKVGRTCYKSEDKITADSAVKFVGGLVKRGHEAMIEHWSLIFKTGCEAYWDIAADQDLLMRNGNAYEDNAELIEKNLRPFLRFTNTEVDGGTRYIVSGNMRAWRDFARAYVNTCGQIPDYMYGMIRCYPTFFPEFQDYIPAIVVNDILIPITVNDLVGEFEHSVHHDVTVKFICDRGVSHEIVRHRTASFAQESTRYCNYGLGKFGGEITVIMPAKWIDAESNNIELSDDSAYQAWAMGIAASEHYYFDMLDAGSTPQEARAVLPNSLKTEVIMTTNLDGWDHFLHLRCAPDAQPDIQVVAKLARGEFWKLFPERYITFPTNRKEG